MTAVSSITTPAAFTLALAVWVATSSRDAEAALAIAATSSNNAINPVANLTPEQVQRCP